MTVVKSVPSEKSYIKYAWIFPFITGLSFATFFGPGLMYGGCSLGCFGPAIPASTPQAAMINLDLLANEIGMFAFFMGILMIMASRMGFSTGNKLSWYVVLWFFFLALSDDVIFGVTGTSLNLPGIIGTILPGIGLVLSYSKAFPKPLSFQ